MNIRIEIQLEADYSYDDAVVLAGTEGPSSARFLLGAHQPDAVQVACD